MYRIFIPVSKRIKVIKPIKIFQSHNHKGAAIFVMKHSVGIECKINLLQVTALSNNGVSID